jgi:hypothetical protein
MADRNLNVTYTIIWSLALANVIGTALCILLSPGIARLTAIRYPLIAPFMIMAISFAAFQATRSLNDLVSLLVVGLIGVFLRRFGWSRPGFLIGFVLATGAERYLYQAVQFAGWSFLSRPIVLLILAITLVSLWAGLRTRPGGSVTVNTEGSASEARAHNLTPQILFTVAVLAAFAFTFQQGVQNSFLALIMPVGVSVVGGIAALLVLVGLLRGAEGAGTVNFDGDAKAQDAGPWPFLLWFAGFIGLVALVGFFAGLVLFFLAFLRLVARSTWAQAAVLTAGGAAFILVLANALNLVFPGGVLQDMYDLPWPFR